ncbi:MAG: thymidine phosphorylase [Anaerolineales bacterium]|nr:thymidine phosphorylase [Anaerolineales bacterium]
MRAVDIIIKKRDGGELTREEIDFFIQGYQRGSIPDYQAAAWAMAVLLRGMSDRETTDLTLAMAASGETLDLSAIGPIVVDKHSTGGVGDKTTLVVAPAVAACGLPVGKLSGRGLGFSGGTLDKLESIPGFRSNLSAEEFLEQLQRVGVVVSGQTADLAPVDGKLYALRDVTGTVQSIPLIASSIMSKKIAAGAKGIVLDVKTGTGAFMKTVAEARRLAELMVSIARLSGRRAIAILSDMNQPLGRAVGNALEIKEAIQTLTGGGPADFREHCLLVAGHMLALGEKARDADHGRQLARQALDQGLAWEKFQAFIFAQGGDLEYVRDTERLPAARFQSDLTAPRDGYLLEANAQVVGETAVLLGAGRAKKGDSIDHGVGLVMHARVGDALVKGQPVLTIHASSEQTLELARNRLQGGIRLSAEAVEPLPLNYGVVG